MIDDEHFINESNKSFKVDKISFSWVYQLLQDRLSSLEILCQNVSKAIFEDSKDISDFESALADIVVWILRAHEREVCVILSLLFY